MDIHKNARSCPASRALLVRRILEEGWSLRAPSRAQRNDHQRAQPMRRDDETRGRPARHSLSSRHRPPADHPDGPPFRVSGM